MRSLKIGLLLDSLQTSVWNRSIIEFILREPSLKLSFVVINQRSRSSGSSNRFVYRLLRKLDRSLFKTPFDQFRSTSLSELFTGIPIYNVSPVQTKFKDTFHDEDIKWIRDQHPDIFIRFGFRILTGEILKVAKYGVWSLHHGDSAVNRGGPPAFWEVVNKEPITGVTLQVLSEKLDSGQVLGKAFCKTDFTSFNRNQQSVYVAGVELFCSRLRDIGVLGSERFFQSLPSSEHESYASTLYRDPTNGQALKISFSFFLRRLKETLSRIFYREQWIIYHHRGQNQPFYFKNAKSIISPNGADWADPFLYSNSGKEYIFFESLEKKDGKGLIRYKELDGMEEGIALQESWHLSYPTIYNMDDKKYMLVEAAASKSVWLYECEQFPNHWKRLRPILQDVELYDPTLYQHEGLWYLFCTQKPVEGTSANMYLYIYYSEDVMGKWKPHPMNPVTRDVRGARPAGKIFNLHGKLVRPSQIGTPKYGYGVRFHNVVKLSTTEFEEIAIDDMIPWADKILATHTYSATGNCFVTDGQIKRFRFF